MSLFRNLPVITLACAVLAGVGAIAEEDPAAGQTPTPQQGQIRGRDLMSPAERAEHRQKMRSMDTEEERKAYREEQHKKMQERAKEQGLTLPEQPGAGPGPGMGGAQGRGGPPR